MDLSELLPLSPADKLKQQKLFESVCKLEKFMRGSFLQAWIGLTNTRIANGIDPETCMYAKMAKRKFYESDEAVNLKKIIEELNGLL